MSSVANTLLAATIFSSFLSPMTARAGANSVEIAAAIDAAFGPVRKTYDVPGMAIAVTDHGKEYFFNYGLASKETNTPVTKDTLFEIGSISKTFTATLACYAIDLGLLSLDDHPGRYMPELRGSAIDKSSLLHLGTYTAGGLPLQFPDNVTNGDEMLTYFREWKPDAPPGEQRRYSNPSLGLFGHIVALAMGRDFADLMESKILSGLGLSHTYIRVPEAHMGDYAWGYTKAGKRIRIAPGVFEVETGSIKISSADLIHYVEDNIHPETLGVPVRRAVEATHVGYFRAGEFVQGLGWEQYPYPVARAKLLAGNDDATSYNAHAVTPLVPPVMPAAPTLFDKTGSTNGFAAYVAFVPAEKIGIVMLANRNFPIPARVAAAHAILEQLSAPHRWGVR